MFSLLEYFKNRNLSSLLLMMIVFFMPIWIKLALLCIPLLLIAWILEGRWREAFSTILRNRFAQIIIFFWILHLVGVLYSTNWKYGLNDVQQKLSFIIFPLILLGFSNDSKVSATKILNIFLIGSIISGLVCLSNAFYGSLSFELSILRFNPVPIDFPYENHFKYTRFSFLFHPSYLSMYFTFSIAILFKKIKEYKGKVILLAVSVSLILYFSILIYLLSSRAGLAALIITILSGAIWLITNRIKWLLRLSLVGLVTILIVVTVSYIGKDTKFISRLNEDLFLNLNPKRSEFNDNYDPRFFIWQSIPTVMSENLVFGYGTGDFHIALNQEYNRRNLVEAAQNDLNAHNQFLESLVSLGLLGLAIMISLIVYPGYRLFRLEDNLLPILFLLIISINFLAESMLSRIAGILFFSVFYSLFFCLRKDVLKT